MSETGLDDAIRGLQGPIAVFGAGGFIGTNLLRRILAVRQDAYGVTHDRSVPWRLRDLPIANVRRADVRDRASLAELFDRFSFRTIFAFAAYGGYARQTDVEQIYATNFTGLVNVLEVAAARGFAAFVHAGSSSEYGLNAHAPREDAALVPNSHYAVSKAAAAHFIRYAGTVRMLPAIQLRYYSVYGPYEDPGRLIPTLIENGLRGGYPPLVDPDISRDFVYVDDAVEAAVLAAAVGVRRDAGGALNIATGRRTSIRELAAAMRALCAIESEPQWGSMPNRAWDLTDWFGNPERARDVLGWEPRTALEDGLRRTLEWQREHPDRPSDVPPVPLGRPTRLSAVIACYRDAQAIPLMHERLTRVFTGLGVDYEIIFVNDGSPDESDTALADITGRDPHVVAVEHSRNFGSQNAFLSGMQLATGDAVVLFDGDLQDPPEVVPAFFEKWREGYEVVYGRRVQREAGRVMNACYKAFYRLFRNVSYVPIPVDAGDFSLMDRKVVDQLLALPETDQFLRGLRAWVGFRQTGVDYVRPERAFGRSTNNLFRNIWWAKKAIFSFSFAPLEWMSYAGAAMTAVAFLGVVWQILAKVFGPHIPHGISTIIVLILFFGGLQLLAVSVVGEYLVRVFEETKKRPKFIRRAVRHAGRHLTTAQQIGLFLERRRR